MILICSILLTNIDTATPYNEKHTSLSSGTRGQRLAARARAGGGSGAGRRVGKRRGWVNSDITIDSQQNCSLGIAAAHTKGIKGIALQELPALWNRPPLPSILRFARPINLSSERKGRVTI